jgi:hypothetical protein
VPGGTPVVKRRVVNISLHIMSSIKAIVFILLPLLMTYDVAGDADAPAPKTAGGSRIPFVVKLLKRSCASHLTAATRNTAGVCAFI